MLDKLRLIQPKHVAFALGVGAFGMVAVAAVALYPALTGKKTVPAVATTQSPPIDRRRTFRSTEAIRKHYGRLHRVILNDERVFTGFAIEKGAVYVLHIKSGVIEVSRDQVRTVREI